MSCSSRPRRKEMGCTVGDGVDHRGQVSGDGVNVEELGSR